MKQFRQREDEETNRIAHEQLSPFLRHRKQTQSDSQLPGDEEEVTDGMVDAVKEITQRDLEKLPSEIIQQARKFHEHMRYYVNHGQGLGFAEEKSRPLEERRAKVPQDLRQLLDEIAAFEGIGERGKREIMQDEDSRNVRWFSLFIFASCLTNCLDSFHAEHRTYVTRSSRVAV